MNLISLLKETKHNILTNKFIFTFTMVTLSIIFVMGSFFASFIVNTVELNEYLKGNVFIKIYLTDNITKVGQINLKEKLFQFNQVNTIRHQSKKIALQKMGESLGIDLNQTENPLPETLVVYLNSSENIEELVNRFINEPGVQEIDVNMDFIQKISTLSEKIGLFILFFLTGITVLIIVLMTNLIHFTILHRKEELEIMYFMGASKWYIKIPIILESIITALVANIINIGVFFPFYKYVSENIIEIMPTLRMVEPQEMFRVLIILALLTGFIAIVTSYASVKLYLRASGGK